MISVGACEVSSSDAASNLFLRKSDVGAKNVEAACQARVQELNVHTTVEHHVFKVRLNKERRTEGWSEATAKTKYCVFT